MVVLLRKAVEKAFARDYDAAMPKRPRLRVLVLVHEDLVPPPDADELVKNSHPAWETEYDVLRTIRRLGHEAHALGVQSDLGVIRSAIEVLKPDIAFNLLEEFHGIALYDQAVVGYLELMRTPYTGCNPRGLMLARDKVLTKKILAFHRIPVPAFAVMPIGRPVRRPRKLQFPLLVKSVSEEASRGISQASVVRDDEKLAERVAFIHAKVGTDALVEQYIEGRELYVGVIGNRRLRSFPVWEMFFGTLAENGEPIATEKVKFDVEYQARKGVRTGPAVDLPEGVERRIARLCPRIYRALGLTGFARIDLRLTPAGEIFVLEANPNPNLEKQEDFALSARAAKVSYTALIQRILQLGLAYRAAWKGA